MGINLLVNVVVDNFVKVLCGVFGYVDFFIGGEYIYFGGLYRVFSVNIDVCGCLGNFDWRVGGGGVGGRWVLGD